MKERILGHFRVAIVGSGFAGIGAAKRLLDEGIDDFVIFERAKEVGGVWRDNQYPGCACDVHSHLYSFSWAQNPSWTRAFSPQQEIWAYLKGVAERFGILPYVRFEHAVVEARWDASERHWRIETSQGLFTADTFVAANGGLSEPSYPNLPGIDSFTGKTMHSARWDHDYDLTGKRVAVVGTGASAIQLIPKIQPKVEKLTVFQRTPPWVVPRGDREVPLERRRFFEEHPRALSALRGAIYGVRELMALPLLHPSLLGVGERMARRHLERQVPDPVLRAKVTPSYRMGCKRILVSDDYYPAITQPNVDVVTSGIREVRTNGVVTSDGAFHEVDAIIFGTGFQVAEMKIASQIHGRDGRSLSEVWNGSAEAHLGTTVHGFPGLFMLQGPNTGLGHTSVIVIIESQIEHLIAALKNMEARNLVAIEPKVEAQAAFVAHVQRKLGSTVWNTGGCQSWYLDKNGRNSTLWPGFTFTFARRVEPFDPKEYIPIARITRARRPAAAIERSAPRVVGEGKEATA